MMNAIILYYSKTGHTLDAANAVAEGIRGVGGRVDVVSVYDFQAVGLLDYDALIVGSPCWAGSFLPGVAKPIMRIMDALSQWAVQGMVCGGFSVHSQLGGENTVRMIGGILKNKGCCTYYRGPATKAGAPMSLWTGPAVRPSDIERFRSFGVDFVRKHWRT